MSLKIKNGNNDIRLNQIEFQEDTACFKLTGNVASGYEEKIEIEVKYLLEVHNDFEHRINDFSIYAFYNNKCSENSIFQVYDKEQRKRIGWIFPIQALVSNQHDFYDNKYFLRYAYIAMKKLLEANDNINIKDIQYKEECYSLLDFYDDEIVILILDGENTNKIECFNIDDYMIDLYKYGYCLNNGSNDLDYFEEIKGNLNLNRIKPYLRKENYIIELFKNYLGREKKDLLKFYLMYQIIELIMEKIFNKELLNIIDSLSNDEKSLFDVKEDLSKVANEKDRINKLTNKYSGPGITCIEELQESCNRLLECQGKKTANSVGNSLYTVRNLLVHNYREVTKENRRLIKDININLEKYIIELLTISLLEV